MIEQEPKGLGNDTYMPYIRSFTWMANLIKKIGIVMSQETFKVETPPIDVVMMWVSLMYRYVTLNAILWPNLH